MIRNSLIKLGFKSLIDIEPKNEFLIKLILLFNDYKNKIITSTQFSKELFFLFYKLSLVKDFDGVDSLFGTDNFFAKIISNIKIAQKSLKNYFDDQWNLFKEISNYDFLIELKDKSQINSQDLIETNNWKDISKIAAAIGLKTAIDYYIAREKFLKTQQGQDLNLKITQAKNNKEKAEAIKSFTKLLPEYNTILSDTQKRTWGFLRRIKGIRNNWNSFVDKIKPVLLPYFDSIGLPFELIIRKFEDLDGVDKAESFYYPSQVVIDPDLGNIAAMDINQVDYMDF